MSADQILVLAYQTIFERRPDEALSEADLSREIIENFNVPKLGLDRAKQVIFKIVNHVHFSSAQEMTSVVLRAEGFASEIWGDIGDEPHMNAIEWKERSEK